MSINVYLTDLKWESALLHNLASLAFWKHSFKCSLEHTLASGWDNDVRLPSNRLCDGQNEAFSPKMSSNCNINRLQSVSVYIVSSGPLTTY